MSYFWHLFPPHHFWVYVIFSPSKVRGGCSRGGCCTLQTWRPSQGVASKSSQSQIAGISPKSLWDGSIRRFKSRAELKVTDLRWHSPICGFLRKSSVSCGFLRFLVPSKCWNFQEKVWIWENLRFSAKICVWVLSVTLVPSPSARPEKLCDLNLCSNRS